jgi:hypothetical protein
MSAYKNYIELDSFVYSRATAREGAKEPSEVFILRVTPPPKCNWNIYF